MEIPPEIIASLTRFDQEFPPFAQAANQTLEDLASRHKIFGDHLASAMRVLESGAPDSIDGQVADELKSVARFQREWIGTYSQGMNRMLDKLYDELVTLYSCKAVYAKALWDTLRLDGMVGVMRGQISSMEGFRDQLSRLVLTAPEDIGIRNDAIARTSEVLQAVTYDTTYLMRLKVSLWSGDPLPQKNS